MTDRENFEALKAIPENGEFVEWIDKKIATLDKKAEAAKKYKAKKNSNMEAEKAIVLDVISTEPKTVADVLSAVEDKIEGISRNKVIARLTALVNDGAIEKADVKDDGRTVKAYALPGSFEAAEAE